MDFELLEAQAGLTEGQKRSLRRIEEGRRRALAAVEAAYLGLTEEACQGYVDAVLAAALPEGARSVLETVSGAVEDYRARGGAAELLREDSDNALKLTVRLYRQGGGAPASAGAVTAGSAPSSGRS